MIETPQHISADGMRCTCQEPASQLSINAQLQSQIQQYITKYYQAWLVCDDSQCRTRTQQCGVYGRRCLSGTCRGEMQYEYSDQALYNQLLYLDHLFDVDKVKAATSGSDELERIKIVAEQNRLRFEQTRSLLDSYLKKCGRRYVDMASIFSFC